MNGLNEAQDDNTSLTNKKGNVMLVKEKLEALRNDEMSIIKEIKTLEQSLKNHVDYLNKIQGGIEALEQVIQEGNNEEVNNNGRREEQE